MVQCVASFLDFCYLARRSSHNENNLIAMTKALESFHEHRTVFVDAGIATDEVSLPRQHALDHYITGITLFASPNGLCTSITESKHIRAVKEPWRRSSRNNALGQMLKTNERLDKLTAARMTFKMHGLLEDDIIVDTLRQTGQFDDESNHGNDEVSHIDDEEDAGGFNGQKATSHVEMASKNGA
jgi:alcohol dehydrogenase class IV